MLSITCSSSSVRGGWPPTKQAERRSDVTRTSQYWISSRPPPMQLLGHSSTPTNTFYSANKTCMHMYNQLKLQTYNGCIVNASLLEQEIISEPRVLRFGVEKPPILDEIPIELVNRSHHRSHQNYHHPRLWGLPSICQPCSGRHHCWYILPKVSQVVHVTLIEPSPHALNKVKHSSQIHLIA